MFVEELFQFVQGMECHAHPRTASVLFTPIRSGATHYLYHASPDDRCIFDLSGFNPDADDKRQGVFWKGDQERSFISLATRVQSSLAVLPHVGHPTE